jgi:poly(3-hydroxybutyrate) depolymerase
MLHGCTQSADDFAAGTRMNFLAETEGLLVLYLLSSFAVRLIFQLGNGQWNIPALRKLLEEILPQKRTIYNLVDPGRVYVAGLSAGGAMAAIMAATYPDLYAAVGVHSGLAPGNAHDLPSALQAMQGRGLGSGHGAAVHTIPLILFQGDQDTTVHPRNAEEFIRQWAGAPDHPPVAATQGQVAGGRGYSCAVYQNPSGQPFVEWWTIHGAKHAWSGGSRHGSFTDPAGPDASRELLRFFREHPRTTV